MAPLTLRDSIFAGLLRSANAGAPDPVTCVEQAIRADGWTVTRNTPGVSMRGQTLLKGHALRNEGRSAPNPPPLVHSWAIAQCECGTISPMGLTIRARQRWHAEHKAEVAACDP